MGNTEVLWALAIQKMDEFARASFSSFFLFQCFAAYSSWCIFSSVCCERTLSRILAYVLSHSFRQRMVCINHLPCKETGEHNPTRLSIGFTTAVICIVAFISTHVGARSTSALCVWDFHDLRRLLPLAGPSYDCRARYV